MELAFIMGNRHAKIHAVQVTQDASLHGKAKGNQPNEYEIAGSILGQACAAATQSSWQLCATTQAASSARSAPCHPEKGPSLPDRRQISQSIISWMFPGGRDS